MNSQSQIFKEEEELYDFDDISEVYGKCEQGRMKIQPNDRQSSASSYVEYQMVRMKMSFGENSDINNENQFSNGKDPRQIKENQDLSLENLTRKRMLPTKYQNQNNTTNFRPPWNTSTEVFEPRALKYQILGDPPQASLESKPNKLVRDLACSKKLSNSSATTNTDNKIQTSTHARPYWRYAYQKVNPKIPADNPKILENKVKTFPKGRYPKIPVQEFGDNYKATNGATSAAMRLASNAIFVECSEPSGDKTLTKPQEDPCKAELAVLKSTHLKLMNELKELRWKIVQSKNENTETKENYQKLLAASAELESENKFLRHEILQVNHKVTKITKAEAFLQSKILELENALKKYSDEETTKENELIQLRMENNSLRKLNERLRQEILLNSRIGEYRELETMFKSVKEKTLHDDKYSSCQNSPEKIIVENEIEEVPREDMQLNQPGNSEVKLSDPRENEKQELCPEMELNKQPKCCGQLENQNSSEKLIEIVNNDEEIFSKTDNAKEKNDSNLGFGDIKMKNRLLERLFERKKPIFIIGFGDTSDE